MADDADSARILGERLSEIINFATRTLKSGDCSSAEERMQIDEAAQQASRLLNARSSAIKAPGVPFERVRELMDQLRKSLAQPSEGLADISREILHVFGVAEVPPTLRTA
jgi:hypothetical protein